MHTKLYLYCDFSDCVYHHTILFMYVAREIIIIRTNRLY